MERLITRDVKCLVLQHILTVSINCLVFSQHSTIFWCHVILARHPAAIHTRDPTVCTKQGTSRLGWISLCWRRGIHAIPHWASHWWTLPILKLPVNRRVCLDSAVHPYSLNWISSRLSVMLYVYSTSHNHAKVNFLVMCLVKLSNELTMENFNLCNMMLGSVLHGIHCCTWRLQTLHSVQNRSKGCTPTGGHLTFADSP